MGPLNPHRPMSRYVRELSCPSVDGISPSNLLPERASCWSDGNKLPSAAGMLPLNKFEVNSKVFNWPSDATDAGILPLNRLLATSAISNSGICTK
mmetsp:Transcript_18572/g.30813  ORF Transcript_18572/g.30813 Transcript_18572/m.30813 type:complete len:95 (-) Transcript_18572:95-379(-)